MSIVMLFVFVDSDYSLLFFGNVLDKESCWFHPVLIKYFEVFAKVIDDKCNPSQYLTINESSGFLLCPEVNVEGIEWGQVETLGDNHQIILSHHLGLYQLFRVVIVTRPCLYFQLWVDLLQSFNTCLLSLFVQQLFWSVQEALRLVMFCYWAIIQHQQFLRVHTTNILTYFYT